MRHLSKTYLPLNKDQLLFTTLINYLLLLYHFRRSHLYVPHSPVAIWAHIRTHTCTRTCWPFTFSSVQVRKCLKTSESATTGWLHIRSIHSCSWRSRWFTKSSSNRPESKSSKHSLIKIKDLIQKSKTSSKNQTSYLCIQRSSPFNLRQSRVSSVMMDFIVSASTRLHQN